MFCLMNKKKSLLKKGSIVALITGLFTAISLFVTKTSFAEVSDEELLKEYEKLESILNISSGWLYDDIIRSLGWKLIKGLVWINDFFEKIVTTIVTLNNFYDSPQMERFMDIAKPLVFGVFVIAVFVLGILFILNKIEKRSEVLLNLLMAVAIVVVIPVLMTEMGKVVGFGIGWMGQTSPTLAGGVIKSNTADLKYYAEKDFATAGRGSRYVGNDSTPPRPLDKNNVNVGTTEYRYANQLDSDISDIDINEKLDLDTPEKKGGYKEWGEDQSEKAQEFLKHKAVPTGVGTKKEVKELRDPAIKFTNLGEEKYYRYHVNWGTTILTLLVTAFALMITVIKVGRVIFDLAFHQLFGMFVAVSDLTGGQRTKKVLAEIANSFAVIFIMVVIIKIFTLYGGWVTSIKPQIGSVGTVLMLIAGAWAVIDAPDIVQRIMGIDAGLRSGYGALMGAYAGASLAGKGYNLAKNFSQNVVTKGAGLAGLGYGFVKGNKVNGGRGSSISKNSKISSSEIGRGYDDNREKLGLYSDQKADLVGSNNRMRMMERNEGSEQLSISENRAEKISSDFSDEKVSPNISVSEKSEQDKNKKIYSGRNRHIRRNQSKLAANVQNKNRGSFAIGSDVEQAKQGLIPQGYIETPSGLVIPLDSKKATPERNIKDVVTMNSFDTLREPTIEKNVPDETTTDMKTLTDQVQKTSDIRGNIQQPVMGYGGQGGIITGSQLFNRARHSFERGANTGAFVKNVTSQSIGVIKKVSNSAVKGGYKATVGTIRAISHPKETASYAGVKLHQLQEKSINMASSTVGKVKHISSAGRDKISSGLQRTIKDIRTPLGHTQPKTQPKPINIDLRGSKDIRK